MKNILDFIINNKRILIMSGIFVITCVLLIVLINIISFNIQNNVDTTNLKHAIIINENVSFYKKAKESKWKFIREFELGENLYIIESKEDKKGNKWLKVKAEDRFGYVLEENVASYVNDKSSKYTLVSDVSKFNFQFNHFKSAGDFKAFLINSKINYVYIRAGGRGYGEEGNFYDDPKSDIYIDACEFLGIPYGFYFVDNAKDEDEINEEVKYMKKFIKKYGKTYNKLPVMLDVEDYNGAGRLDKMWEERGEIVQQLVDEFKANNMSPLLYTNANYAHDYLKDVNAPFWLAYYDQEGKIPKNWLSTLDKEFNDIEELNNKVVAWQFTETGVTKRYPVDLSIIRNNYLDKFIK